MLSCFDFVRELDFFAVAVRMVLAVFCGGLIGIEREYSAAQPDSEHIYSFVLARQ